ncbi:MAG TPA: hypothetical protein DCX95_01475 [Elusimicrobia bacterium]|nr:hypothetical protein [Elusimicrobiota bacterium]
MGYFKTKILFADELVLSEFPEIWIKESSKVSFYGFFISSAGDAVIPAKTNADIARKTGLPILGSLK